MKLRELIKEKKEVNLIGRTIGFKLVTPKTRNEFWPGVFSCRDIGLTTLVGAPKKVERDFLCNSNQLTSLEGAPTEIRDGFDCEDNLLTSLKHCPKKIGGYFDCSHNYITSLIEGPVQVGDTYYCTNNKLTSLEGAPKEVGGHFICSSNLLTSLEGAPNKIGYDFLCNDNKLTSLKDIHKIITKMNGEFFCKANPITSHVLGLLLIPGIKIIYCDDDWGEVLNKYLRKGRKGLIDCQNELIEAGLEEYAQI